MSEVYVNGSERVVLLYVPSDITPVTGTFDVTVFKGSVEAATINTVVALPSESAYSIVLPFFLLQEDAELRINWKFNYVESTETFSFENDTYINVVTPYVPLRDIEKMLEDEDDFTAEDIKDIERATRHIINSYTGQSFGHSTGTVSVRGNGKSSLELPSRLVRLDMVNGLEGTDQYYQIRGEGWYLGGPSLGAMPTRGFTPDWSLGVPNPENPDTPVWVSGGVITSPYASGTASFTKNAIYNINGMWGWKRVPRKVEEAAKLLINDYATGDTVYRDRYLTSMTAADWRIQFHSGAFQHTGNVRADQLLNDYVLQRGWMVL